MIVKNKSTAGEIAKAKEMARIVIAHHFGNKKPRRIVHKASGLSNFVFAVDHAEGDFIVRLSFDAARINLFIKEQWAQSQAREVGVPVAEILEVGNEIIPHPFMIARTVAGREATSHPQRAEILRELGRFAALINSIKTSSFGATFDWSNNQLSRNENWADYLQDELKFEDKINVLEKRRMLTDEQLKNLQKIFDAALKLKPKPALNHGDIRLKNVIVDAETGKINAILDWEHCTSNLAPQWELSLALHDLWIDEKQIFLEGYGLTEKKMRDALPLIKAFNVINYAPTVERMAEAKETARLEQYRTRLSGALDLYSF